MKRLEKVKKILAAYQDTNTVPELVRSLGISRYIARIYSTVLTDNGLLERIELEPYQKVRMRIAYRITDLKLTDELFKKVDEEITALYYKKRKIPENVIAERKAKKQETEKEKKTVKKAQEEKSEHEKRGVYLLSTNPSKHFEDKYKAQQAQIRSEYKSPKNYAGVSAGMVW